MNLAVDIARTRRRWGERGSVGECYGASRAEFPVSTCKLGGGGVASCMKTCILGASVCVIRMYNAHDNLFSVHFAAIITLFIVHVLGSLASWENLVIFGEGVQAVADSGGGEPRPRTWPSG